MTPLEAAEELRRIIAAVAGEMEPELYQALLAPVLRLVADLDEEECDRLVKHARAHYLLDHASDTVH